MDKYVFGVDVGGTTVKLGLFTVDGNLLDKWEIPTNTADGGKEILPDVAKSILAKMEERNLTKKDVEGVGIGTPGPVDAKGTVYMAVNLGWGMFSVKNEMQSLLGMPVEAANDANVAALGEVWQGSAKGFQNAVFAVMGTGVGGGIIVNGKILSGATGSGGEIGHMHVNDEETIACNCGNFGCLEQYVSATGIVRMANEMIAASDQPSVLKGISVTSKDVWDAVKAGDSLAVEIAEKFGQCLGKALAQIASVSNPEVFVLGGGVSKAGTVLIDYVEKYFQKYAFEGCRGALFTIAKLGNDAGIYGAAKMVLK